MARRRKPHTMDDVINFISGWASQPGELEDALEGRILRYELVDAAIRHFHANSQFLDLQAYDLKGTNNMWKSGVVKNYELARMATKTFLNKINNGKPLEELLTNLTVEAFTTTPINRYGTTLTGMLSNVYGYSVYEAIKDLVENEPSLSSYTDLQPYDMHMAPIGTWTLPGKKKNFELARQATKTLINTVRGDQSIEEVLPLITQDTFIDTPINRYGTKLAGMLERVYDGSPYSALRDLFDNDPEYGQHADFEQYDMQFSPRKTWIQEDGSKNLKLARKATKTLILKMAEGRSIEQTLPLITINNFYETPINRYGTKLVGMFSRIYESSPYAAIRDLIDNDQDFHQYKDFEPYDMHMAPQHTWLLEDGTTNKPLARRAIASLLHTLKGKDSMEQAFSKVRHDSFQVLPVNRYGTTLGGMLHHVYGHSPQAALNDLVENDPGFRQHRNLIGA